MSIGIFPFLLSLIVLSKISSDLFESGFVIEEIGEPRPTKPPDGVVFNAYGRTMKKPARLMVRSRKQAR